MSFSYDVRWSKIVSLAKADHSKLEENVQVQKRFSENAAVLDAWLDTAVTQYVEQRHSLSTKQQLEDVQGMFQVRGPLNCICILLHDL